MSRVSKLEEEHIAEALSKGAEIYKLGWNRADDRLESKTDKGVLITIVKADGRFYHEWHLSKHDQDITWRISCDGKAQRDRLKAKAKAKASELSEIRQGPVEYAELLEYLLDQPLPDALR
jgi:hypothetical protein